MFVTAEARNRIDGRKKRQSRKVGGGESRELTALRCSLENLAREGQTLARITA